jgi:pimeloyl-ACP methyl ester carboxylesterase
MDKNAIHSDRWIIEEFLEFRSNKAWGAWGAEEKFNTTLYYTQPDVALKGFPGVDKSSKVIVIGLTGTGTTTSSGRVFLNHGLSLSQWGVSVVGVDHPFHGGGSQSRRYLSRVGIDRWIEDLVLMVRHYKRSGLPVYIMGKCGGSMVAQEILYRYPELLDGVFMVTPTAQTTELADYYREFEKSEAHAEYQREAGTVADPKAMQWDRYLDKAMRSMDQPITSRTPVYMLTGEHDNFVTMEGLQRLVSLYRNASLQLLPDVGHDFYFLRGQRDLVLVEELLDFLRRNDIEIQRESQRKRITDNMSLRNLWEMSPLFQAWLGRPIEGFLENPRAAEGILEQWSQWKVAALQRLSREVLSQLDYLNFASKEEIKEIRRLSEKKSLESEEYDTLMGFLKENLERFPWLPEENKLL